MDPTLWNAILSRIGRHDAEDIDDLLAPHDAALPASGRDLFPLPEAVLMPATAFRREDGVAVGLRAGAAGPDVVDRATRLAAFAAERDVEIVVLASADRSGFERFGFRVERVAGDTAAERDACEGQLRRFWNLDLVL